MYQTADGFAAVLPTVCTCTPQVLELKSVISSLDSSSRDGALRMTRISGQTEQVRQVLAQVEQENEILKRHIRYFSFSFFRRAFIASDAMLIKHVCMLFSERDEKISALTEALGRLDEQRDDLQNQLDAIAEQATVTDDVQMKVYYTDAMMP